MDYIRHNCGVGMAQTPDDAHHLGQFLNHRGRELAGIGGMGRRGIDVVKWLGPVSSLSPDAVDALIDGDFFTVHTRYSTSGRKGSQLDYAHPQVIGGLREERGNHLVIREAEQSLTHNGSVPQAELDGRGIEDVPDGMEGFDTMQLLHLVAQEGVEEVVRRVPGSYAAVYCDVRTGRVAVFRDRHGIKPMWLGEKGRRIVAASEDSAIARIGGVPLREVRPGEVVWVSRDDFRSVQAAEPEPRVCIYEPLYLMDSQSTWNGRVVRGIRYKLGAEIAEEFRPRVDAVTWAPSCPKPAARGYADATGVQLAQLLYKFTNKRSFQEATQEEREASISGNLWVPEPRSVRGKRVLLIDDSTVRGTVSRVAIQRLREAGASEVHLALYTPPIAPLVTEDGVLRPTGCEYGVDIPLQPRAGEGYLSRVSGEGAAAEIGATSVHYLSPRRLFRALGVPVGKSCYRCLGGPKPFAHG